MKSATLAAHIARHIFEIGADRGRPVQRIQFMGGEWPHAEIEMGGLNETALASAIHEALAEFTLNRGGKHD